MIINPFDGDAVFEPHPSEPVLIDHKGRGEPMCMTPHFHFVSGMISDSVADIDMSSCSVFRALRIPFPMRVQGIGALTQVDARDHNTFLEAGSLILHEMHAETLAPSSAHWIAIRPEQELELDIHRAQVQIMGGIPLYVKKESLLSSRAEPEDSLAHIKWNIDDKDQLGAHRADINLVEWLGLDAT